MDAPKFMGARVKRREDPRLITGHAAYVDDIQLPRMLHLEVLRSVYAHARIVRIDMPLWPERVWRAIQQARGQFSSSAHPY